MARVATGMYVVGGPTVTRNSSGCDPMVDIPRRGHGGSDGNHILLSGGPPGNDLLLLISRSVAHYYYAGPGLI